MLFTLSAQILDTLLIKTSVFAATQAVNLICWTGSTVYYSYVPKPLTERERLQLQINDLKLELELLKREKLKDISGEELDHGIIAI